MEIKPESFNRDSFYNSKEELLSYILSSNYSITENDVLILSEPMDKMCRCKDLMEWFGYGIYILSMRHKGECVSNGCVMEDEVIGNLRGIRLGLNNIHSIANSLKEDYPEVSPYVNERLLQAVNNGDKIDFLKWEKEAPEELYHICVKTPRSIEIGIDNWTILEPYQKMIEIPCSGFSKICTVFCHREAFNLNAIISPSSTTTVLPSNIFGNKDVNVDLLLGSCSINNIVLPTQLEQNIIIGRDLLQFFSAKVELHLEGTTLWYEYTTLFNGFLLDKATPKTLKLMEKMFTILNNDFYVLCGNIHNLDLDKPTSIYKAFIEDYPDFLSKVTSYTLENLKYNFKKKYSK